eukprot:scaffold140254_cov133-Phaeocystis_antarctica.AAC.3
MSSDQIGPPAAGRAFGGTTLATPPRASTLAYKFIVVVPRVAKDEHVGPLIARRIFVQSEA